MVTKILSDGHPEVHTNLILKIKSVLWFFIKVEICRHGCLDHCQSNNVPGHYIQDRKDNPGRPLYPQTTQTTTIHEDETSLYDDIIQNGDEMASIGGQFLRVEKSSPKAQAQISNRHPTPIIEIPDGTRPHEPGISHSFLVSICFLRNWKIEIIHTFIPS